MILQQLRAIKLCDSHTWVGTSKVDISCKGALDQSIKEILHLASLRPFCWMVTACTTLFHLFVESVLMPRNMVFSQVTSGISFNPKSVD